jgi:hypothetical protein
MEGLGLWGSTAHTFKVEDESLELAPSQKGAPVEGLEAWSLASLLAIR